MFRNLLIMLVWGLAGLSAHAQATRTWVSGVGDDANPCSRTAPCKTFAGAISKTAAGGEISVLDPGGYGAVTITKSMTINGEGTLGSILNAGANGVVINDSANTGNMVVVLRNITINGTTTGLSAVRLLSAAQLHMENVTVLRGGASSAPAINLVSTTPATVSLNDVAIYGCAAAGVSANPPSGTSMRVSLNRVRVAGCGTGLSASADSVVHVADSMITGNATGVSVSGNAAVSLSNSSLLSDNTVPCSVSGSGSLQSYGNNRLANGCQVTAVSNR